VNPHGSIPKKVACAQRETTEAEAARGFTATGTQESALRPQPTTANASSGPKRAMMPGGDTKGPNKKGPFGPREEFFNPTQNTNEKNA